MTVTTPATRIATPLNRPFNHRSSLASTSKKPLFLRNPTPSPTIVAVRCLKPFSDGVSSSTESTNHASSVSSSIDFLTLCHRLKTTKRKGWINQGINGSESITDHMYRMSLMALIALLELTEKAIVGDIPPSDGVPKEEKSRREIAALKEMCKVLGGGLRAEEITELSLEYENNASL